MQGSWVREFPASITVCDRRGTILEMNDRSATTFARDGGRSLIGRSVLDCHPEPARGKLEKNLNEHLTNCYTIERNGVKKLVYQAPWYEGGECRGLVELIIELPGEIPHHTR
jgi:transcriptional regulator with PAS, ATPase and Fis domain